MESAPPPTPLGNHNQSTPSKKTDIKDLKGLTKDNYQLAINYYSKDNPFKKIIIGSTVGAIGSYSASTIALSMSGAYLYGGLLFYDNSILFAGYSLLIGNIAFYLAIPAILGGIGYAIFRYKKTNDLKNFMNKLSDKNDESTKEEREIFSILNKECKDYFKNFILTSFTIKLRDIIENDTKKILIKIKDSIKDENSNIILNEMKKEINEINSINIILIGNTGVGKSALINEFLQLKNNKAKEGVTSEPQIIEGGWPKKYPVEEKDTDLLGINLYDTEGIEKKGKNNFDEHLSKIVKYINSPDSIIKNKINAIWYCINSNKLDGDEYYINKILDLFSERKIPIIFIFTKATQSREDDIEIVEKGLKNFDYFKKNPDKFYFIPVIAKDYISKRTGKLIDGKFGLDKLFETTKNLAKDTIMAPIMKKISDEFNKNSMEIINNLSKRLQKQYEDIISKHDKIETFKQKFYDIFETIFGEFDASINDVKETEKDDFILLDISIKDIILSKIDSWILILESIKNSDLVTAIKNYNNHYLLNKVELNIKEKYEEKIKRNNELPLDEQYKKNYDEFKKDINDYLITQMNNSKDIYGLYTLFDIARDTMLEVIFKYLEIDLNQKKEKVTIELSGIIAKKIEEFQNKFSK